MTVERSERSEPRRRVWLASYPRSGNTWMRFLIASLSQGPQHSAAAVARLIPDAHKELATETTTEPPLVKTHCAFGPGLPHANRTKGFIYMVRDPLDVIASNWWYFYLTVAGQTRSWSAHRLAEFQRQYIDVFIALGGEPRWFNNGAGTWCDNVTSWLDEAPGLPHLLVRYEQLVADAPGQARRVCEFLSLDRGETEIAAAVSAASLEAMRRVEESDIAAHRTGLFFNPERDVGYAAGVRFLNRGGPGGGRELLSRKQIKRACAAFGPVMRRLDYSTT